MSIFMTELHDFRTTGRHNLPPAAPMLNLMPYRTHETHGYEAAFDLITPAERTYHHAGVSDFQANQERKYSTPLPSSQCDDDSAICIAGTIEPYHLNAFQQDRPRTAFEGNRRTRQFLNSGQQYLQNDPIHSIAYYLDDGFHALDRPRFSSTSTFETAQHALYQIPYSDSVTPPSGSPSPTVAWSRIQGNMGETSCRGEDAIVGREDLEEDDVGSDKPYARLIWEALMQAPGHRMMLREIYAWFQSNTNKAKESGSNGWQNSIRHNLSMNQAFENDKSDSSILHGQAKKANSVWVLTESAIKDGVQSTTRYRKTGSGKKTHASRTPAPLRQRSGAKGGRAARRAARIRRNEQDNYSDRLSFPGIPSPPDPYASMGMNVTTNDADYMSIHTPATPTNDLSYSFSSAFAIPTYPAEVPMFYNSEEEYAENAASVQQEFVTQPQKDPCLGGIDHFLFCSNPREISM